MQPGDRRRLGWAHQVVYQPGPDECVFAFPAFDGVSCASAAACTAVGGVGGDSGPDEPMAYRFDGRAWKNQNPVIPTDDGDLNRVSCPAISYCVAVGTNGDGDGPFAEAWHRTGWSLRGSPPDGYLHDVSCPTVRICVAVGDGPASTAVALRGHGSFAGLPANVSPSP